MAQSPGASSPIKSIALRFSSVQPAGAIVHIQTAGGEEIVTFKSEKSFQSLVVSSPKLQSGVTYDVYTGGTATGTNQMGFYPAGAYSGGTKSTTTTVSTGATGR